MPQVQIVNSESYETPNRAEENLKTFFTKLGKDYKEKSDRDEIGKILGEHERNRKDADNFEKTQLALEKSTISPSRRLEAQKTLNETQKLILQQDKELNSRVDNMAEKERARKSVYEIYKPHLGEEEAQRLSKIDTEATARSKVGQLSKVGKNNEPVSQFEKTLQAEEAKKLVKLEEDIPKARDALKNLDRIDQLVENELSGAKGFVKSAFKTQSAKELENLSFTAIEPIIKLFNPVGPIPVQKVRIIQKQFQIHPSDLKSTAKGKISALRRIGEQALARGEQRANIIRKYKGNPPYEELQQFDKDSSALQDTLLDEESFALKLKDSKEDGLIDGLFSAKDGRKLKPIPKKEAKKLYEQGVITNVPPS